MENSKEDLQFLIVFHSLNWSWIGMLQIKLTGYTHLDKDPTCTGAHNPARATPILGLCHGVFTDWFIFRHILGQIFPRKWNLLNVCELTRSIRYQNGERNVIKRQKLSF